MRIRARRRHVAGEMNGLESRYAGHLDMLKITGQIQGWRFEAVKLKLAPKTFITPGFWVVMLDGTVEFHEVKGFWEDDARVKIKIAAEMFHEFGFVAVTKDKRSIWAFERFGKEEAK